MLKELREDYKILLRSVPAPTVTIFIVSVILMNLLASKELISVPWIALDCGFTMSWVSFLCQDMICKRFGAKASVKISVLALVINLAVTVLFWLISLTPGMWSAYYSTGSIEVNDALNATFAGTWYVVLGSSAAMLCSAFVNSHMNMFIGRRIDNGSFATFAARSYISTLLGQFMDNLVFAIIVSYSFFGWTPVQVVVCAATGAVAELLCEVALSPVAFKVAKGWERDGVGEAYVQRHAADVARANVSKASA